MLQQYRLLDNDPKELTTPNNTNSFMYFSKDMLCLSNYANDSFKPVKQRNKLELYEIIGLICNPHLLYPRA